MTHDEGALGRVGQVSTGEGRRPQTPRRSSPMLIGMLACSPQSAQPSEAAPACLAKPVKSQNISAPLSPCSVTGYVDAVEGRNTAAAIGRVRGEEDATDSAALAAICSTRLGSHSCRMAVIHTYGPVPHRRSCVVHVNVTFLKALPSTEVFCGAADVSSEEVAPERLGHREE